MEGEEKPSLRVIWRLLRLIKPYKWKAVLLYVLLYGALGLDLLKPATVGWAVNYVTQMVSAGGVVSLNILPLVLFYVGISLLRNVLRFRRGLIQTVIVQGISADLRCDLYDKVQQLSFEYHGRAKSGELIARSTRDVDKLRMFFANTVFMGPEIVSYIIGSVVIILMYDIRLAAVALGTAVPTTYLMVRSARKIRPMFKTASDKYDDVTTVLQENIAGARVVRAFGQENREVHKFGGRAGTFTGQMIGAMMVWANSIPFAMFIFRLSIPLTLFYGGILVIREAVSLGTVMACLLYLNSISERMRAIGRMVDFTQRATASGEKIFALLDEKTEIADRENAEALCPGRGRVEFENVSLSLGEQKVLEDISFSVEPGQTVAIVGKTGCGKSSLISLLGRFHDPSEGCIRIDGQDIKDASLDSLRRDIGIVFQDTFLFSASVAENIGYGQPDASIEQIERSARAAGAHPFIEKLENGYETIIGERGVTLSGGEKQRIAIARAIVSDPRILILADATSSVDSYTEREIHEALRELARSKTTFIISQRISAVQHADKIVVLDNGRIAQEGPHAELLEQEGVYRMIYEGQSLENSLSADVRRAANYAKSAEEVIA